MLDRPPVIVDNRLRRTSAWANTFRARPLCEENTMTDTAHEPPGRIDWRPNS